MFYNEDNAVAVVRKAIKHHKVKVSSSSIVERLTSHPDYPSLKSICDSFDEWKIQYYAARLDVSELKETDAAFIAHLYEDGEKLAFVPKLKRSGPVEIFDSLSRSRIISEAEFAKKYSGVSVLLDPQEKSGQNEFSSDHDNEIVDKMIAYAAIAFWAALLAYILVTSSLFNLPGLAFKAVGIAFSVMLFLKGLKIKNSYSELFCGAGPSINCNTVLMSEGSKIFGWFHWSEAGLIYFTGCIFIQSFGMTAGDRSVISLLAISAVSFTVYSIYYQWRIAKAWCSLCLAAQGVIAADAAYYLIYFEAPVISAASLLKAVIVFLLAGLIVMLYKGWYMQSQRSQSNKIQYLKLKRNPAIFNHLLRSGGQKIRGTVRKELFAIGSTAAPVTIDAFLNLKCHPCRKVFEQLADLSMAASVRINFWFAMTHEDSRVICEMKRISAQESEQEFVDFIKSWYREGAMRDSLFSLDERLYTSFERAHYEQFREFGVEVTPSVFVGGYRLPKEYQVKDLSYLIETINK